MKKQTNIQASIKWLIGCLLLIVCSNAYTQGIDKADELEGKRIGVIGDSYVRNHKEPREYTWHYKFAEKHGMVYHNFGKNGNCIAHDRSERWGKPMYTRYADMPDSLDYVIVIGGHNDTAMLDSMGGINVFKEKMAILCEGLINKYPTAKIFFFTRWICDNFQGSNAQQVTDAMIEICGNYSIPIFDAARKGSIYANQEAFRAIYFQSRTDNAHLNAKGHDRFLTVAESFILRY